MDGIVPDVCGTVCRIWFYHQPFSVETSPVAAIEPNRWRKLPLCIRGGVQCGALICRLCVETGWSVHTGTVWPKLKVKYAETLNEPLYCLYGLCCLAMI
ncbi:hypothetical protein CIJ83_01755 [Neisseria meningitidis]|nr:hypothetical protein A6L49_00955 [Neisseria meningitidis]ANX24006.1 hypothetical protein A6L47_07085 [Neisseria meningitidis]ANX39098.1 hypothetical protein A6L48_10295 [Neisseria meningitidis]ANX51700.1 hypothetical protein A6L46_10975 [Neisseria meningitidis]ANX73944.1 hypothetical protein A6L42_07335 [Neisseria meningitidis]